MQGFTGREEIRERLIKELKNEKNIKV